MRTLPAEKRWARANRSLKRRRRSPTDAGSSTSTLSTPRRSSPLWNEGRAIGVVLTKLLRSLSYRLSAARRGGPPDYWPEDLSAHHTAGPSAQTERTRSDATRAVGANREFACR